FFFQAEDGRREFHVTGVQTCALPIWSTVVPSAIETCVSSPCVGIPVSWIRRIGVCHPHACEIPPCIPPHHALPRVRRGARIPPPDPRISPWMRCGDTHESVPMFASLSAPGGAQRVSGPASLVVLPQTV